MDEELMEKKIGSETIFDGNLLHVRRDTVCLPNGKSATREWIQHPGASSVIPVFRTNKFYWFVNIAIRSGRLL